MSSKWTELGRMLNHYRYLIVIVVGILIVVFIDDNSIMRRFQYELQISDLKKQIKEYNERHNTDSERLRQLRRDPKAIEKIARERYFMKTDDEDIYVLSDDEKPTQKQDETTEYNTNHCVCRGWCADGYWCWLLCFYVAPAGGLLAVFGWSGYVQPDAINANL